MTRTELSVIALIGVILLIGIVKKNGILIVDFALEAKRRQGLRPREAIHQAALLASPHHHDHHRGIARRTSARARARCRCRGASSLGDRHRWRARRESAHDPLHDPGHLFEPRPVASSGHVAQGWAVKRRASSKRDRFAVPLWIALLECAGGALGCKVGPDYVKPKVATPAAFQENSTWKLAAPGDDLPRGAWWEIFRDPELDELESKVLISNQTIANAAAQYRGAQAALEARPRWFFPYLGGQSIGYARALVVFFSRRHHRDRAGIRRQRRERGAGAGEHHVLFAAPQSLVGSRFVGSRSAAHRVERGFGSGELGGFRVGEALGPVRACADVFQPSLARCPKGAARGGHARFRVGPRGHQESLCGWGGIASDVLQAESQLDSTRAQAIDLGVARAQLQHAIAVLIGEPAPTFSLAAATLRALFQSIRSWCPRKYSSGAPT